MRAFTLLVVCTSIYLWPPAVAFAQPANGTQGGACYGNGTCNAGLRCDPATRTCVAPAAATANPATCFPACRSGFTCRAGTCVSLCNPPCAAGSVCTPAGECVMRSYVTPGGPIDVDGRTADPGWASGAGTFGYIAAGAVAAMTAVAISVDDEAVVLSMAASGTLLAGVAAPIVAAGSGSARDTHPEVVGSSTLRTVSWVGWGIGMLDAAAIVGFIISDIDVGRAHGASVGALGALSLVGIAMDAKTAASQAQTLREASRRSRLSQVRLTPSIHLARDASGEKLGLFGMRLQF